MYHKGCPEEYPITIYINQKEVATFQLTNEDLKDWAIGYLYSEGFIETNDDLLNLQIFENVLKVKVDVRTDPTVDHWTEKKKHYTAGCGRGVTFFSMTDIKQFKKVQTPLTISNRELLEKMKIFSLGCEKYLETGGMHGACIINNESENDILIREDIGRHNAVDKVIGAAIQKKWDSKNLILLTTGRVSYEMLAKAAKFGIGIIGSRTAATKQAIQLAKVLDIEVIGYIRGKMLIPYTKLGRINILDEVEST